ncbi:hypothetical protein [Streptomyces sp. WAC04189]|uniref:hypothetical protein n=1 Tax=Streptomyces sp. WAC04189 TaxID=2487411 RepID=UPI00163C6810|nr:hypothetical protein [Streptomyces sp. WAC04189]
MRRDGTQWQCRTCKASYDDGAAAASGTEHERAKEPLPARPPRSRPQRATSRYALHR